MNVLQVLLGQSASVMQPRFAFAPPTQAPVSQVPEAVQSASLQHGVLAGSGARQRPVSLTHVPAPPHASVVPQPPPPVQFAPGVVPPEQRIGMRSPVRKMPELSGRLRPEVLPVLQAVAPGEQSAVVVHVEAQSALTRHAVLSFVVSPWTQRLLGGVPPAVSAADAPLTVSVVPLAHAALVIE